MAISSLLRVVLDFATPFNLLPPRVALRSYTFFRNTILEFNTQPTEEYSKICKSSGVHFTSKNAYISEVENQERFLFDFKFIQLNCEEKLKIIQ